MANKDIYDSRSYKKIFLPGQFCQVIDKCVGEYRIEMAQSPFQGKRVVVGGTFNGIVLLALKNPKSRFLKVDDIMLYNPLTRMYNQVPDPPPLVASSIRKYTVSALGFGHGATQDDLKIVTLGGAVVYNNNNNAQSRMEKVRCRHPLSSYSFDWNNDARFWAVGRRPLPSDLFYQDNDAQSRMEGPELSRPLYWNVFSLKNKSWSKLTAEPQLHYSEFSTYAGTFVNGFLYWIITRRKRSFHPFGAVLISSKKLILALDVKKMIFSEIEVVDDIAFDVLGTINGRLCWVTCNKLHPGYYKLSVMNKQGFQPRSKSCLTLLHLRPFYKRFHAMCIFDEGKILMKNSKTKKLLILDLLNDSYKSDVNGVELSDDSHVWKRQSIEYEQSCVSPSDL